MEQKGLGLQALNGSALPTLLLLIETRSRTMKAIVYIVLALDVSINAIYFVAHLTCDEIALIIKSFLERDYEFHLALPTAK